MSVESSRVVLADLTWTGRAFERGVAVAIGADGRIAAVEKGGAAACDPAEPIVRLPRKALLPGLVSAHSHAFQIGLRGRGETYAAGAGDFWSWRQAMYGLARTLDRDALRALCRAAFSEMRDAGFTAVGEFHYLHHDLPGDWGLDPVVLEAAGAAGIRIALLESYYRTGGIGEPPAEAQHRFVARDPAQLWDAVDALADRLDRSTQTVGVAPHSIRAATPEEFAAIHAEARRRGLVVHAHVEEQRAEVEASLAAYGARPTAALLSALGTAEGFTAVHCTHAASDDLARWLDAGGAVCLCPTTEAALGDGIPDLGPLAARLAAENGGPPPLSIGTDGNARISAAEEMRWLEYGQRLRTGRRGALLDAQGATAPALLAAATEGGARALGIEAGRIEAGRWADFATLDLDHPTLAGADDPTLLAAWIFGGGNGAVAATCVGGRWRAAGGGPAW